MLMCVGLEALIPIGATFGAAPNDAFWWIGRVELVKYQAVQQGASLLWRSLYLGEDLIGMKSRLVIVDRCRDNKLVGRGTLREFL